MKFVKKISIITLSLVTAVMLGAAGNDKLRDKFIPKENLEDSALNGKLLDLKHKIKEQRAGLNEATELFKKVIPSTLEGSAKVENLWFADGDTSIVIIDNPIPIRILFKGQFLMDNKVLMDKIGKTVKFKISDVELVEEPIIHTLRLPVTDSKYWIYATFSNYGKAKDGDFIDNIKSGTIPY